MREDWMKVRERMTSNKAEVEEEGGGKKRLSKEQGQEDQGQRLGCAKRRKKEEGRKGTKEKPTCSFLS